MSPASPIPFVQTQGSPFEVGYQHGAALAGSLHAFLDDGLARLDRLVATPVSMRSLAPTLAAYDERLRAATPRLALELDGLAEGAGIGRDQALLLQLRREITGYQRIPTMGDCTTYARAGSHPVLAQTVDLNGDLDDQISVLRIALDDSDRQSLVLSFGGLLGYLGINSDGLAIGLNLVLGGEWQPGVPPYLAIRHLLDTAGSVDEAVEILRGLPLASSRSLTLCDRDTSCYLEILSGEIRVVRTEQPMHTNHFLDPEFSRHDELNVFARNSSILRLKSCAAGLDQLPVQAGVEEHFQLLSAAPICVPDGGDIRRERTVAAVVMLPERGELHVRPGDPSLHPTQSFAL
ncbi:MAG: C45 family peptidase [Actinomycetota bacterium]|nr:C45 family peptidase [Actinomycetota bacterium]